MRRLKAKVFLPIKCLCKLKTIHYHLGFIVLFYCVNFFQGYILQIELKTIVMIILNLLRASKVVFNVVLTHLILIKVYDNIDVTL